MVKKPERKVASANNRTDFKHSDQAHAAVGPSLDELHRVMSALGRRGGRKGGPARAAKLTSQQRSEIARRAAIARWATTDKDET